MVSIGDDVDAMADERRWWDFEKNDRRDNGRNRNSMDFEAPDAAHA